jgi:hypothetical protein
MAGHLPPALAASFASGRCLPVLLLRVDLPAPEDPLCLLYGNGEVPFDGETFVGEDPRFGLLSSLDPPEDGLGDTAPSIAFELFPPDAAASVDLANPAFQKSRVRLWVGGLDTAGALIGTYLMFDGSLDRPLLVVDQGVQSVEFECVSGYERFFTDTEGQRLADSSHQEVWPGETGFIYITGIARVIIWGPGERPGNGVVYGSGGGGFGGGGGGGGRGGLYNVDMQ